MAKERLGAKTTFTTHPPLPTRRPRKASGNIMAFGSLNRCARNEFGLASASEKKGVLRAKENNTTVGDPTTANTALGVRTTKVGRGEGGGARPGRFSTTGGVGKSGYGVNGSKGGYGGVLVEVRKRDEGGVREVGGADVRERGGPGMRVVGGGDTGMQVGGSDDRCESGPWGGEGSRTGD